MWFRDIFRRPERGAAAPRREHAPTGADGGLDDLSFLRRLDRLTLHTGRFLRGEAAGRRPSLRRLPSNDFREHRLYLPGDDLRNVDWNASARAEHVFVRLGERPREASVHILFDNSASMTWGQPSKLWAARRLAASLGYIALSQGDRMAITTLTGTRLSFGPSQGKARLPAMIRYLRDLPVSQEADIAAALRPARPHAGLRYYAHRQARGGFVVLISDLLGAPRPGPELALALGYFPLPGWQVLVLHLLHPAELAPTLRGEIELEDAETGQRANYDLTPAVLAEYRARVRTWCDSVERHCYEASVAYAKVLADWPIEQAVMPYLRRRGVVEAA